MFLITCNCKSKEEDIKEVKETRHKREMTEIELESPVRLQTIDKAKHYETQEGQTTGQSQELYNQTGSSLGLTVNEENGNVLKKRGHGDDDGTANQTTKELSSNAMYNSEANPNNFPDGGKDAYLTLLGSFMGLIIVFGIANSLGAIESYVSTHQLLEVKDTSVSWVFTLNLGMMYFGGVVFGELFDRFGAKKALIAATLILTGGLLLTAQSTKLVHFILSFGIMTAIGTSLGMVPLIGVLSHWFLKKRAFACSVATIGGLIGSSLFAIMLQRLYNQVGFKWAIRILALISLFCMTTATLLIKERHMEPPKPLTPSTEPDQDEFYPSTPQTSNGVIKSIGSFFKGALDLSIVKDVRFVFLTLAVFFAEIISISSLTYLTSYGLDHGVNESNAYLLITLVNVCGIPSRLLSGVLADLYGRFNVMIVMSILTTIVIYGIWLPAKGNVTILFVFAVLFGIATSSTLSLIPAATSQICSAESFGKVYGTLYFFLAFLTILGMYITSLVLGDRETSDYRNFVIYEGAYGIAAIGCWGLARYYAVGLKWCKF